MAEPRHITWENFRQSILEPGFPARLAVPGEPAVQLFVTERRERLGLQTPLAVTTSIPVSSIQQLSFRRAVNQGTSHLEVSTSCAPLFREFFFLALSIADLIQQARKPPLDAVLDAVASWKLLLQGIGRLSIEDEIGLIGELWTLRRLHSILHDRVLDAWTAPSREPHDFRLGKLEIEVKSTVSATRSHIISGLPQLVPSRGHKLMLLSLQFESAGAGDGSSLPEDVSTTTRTLASSGIPAAAFERLLERRSSFNPAEAALYPDRFRLRTPPALIRVEGRFPRIVPRMLEDDLRGEFARVSDASYRINVEGLGVLDGSPAFKRIFG